MPEHRSETASFEDDFLHIAEAARLARVHPTTIARRVKSGDLPAYRLRGGHALRVRREDVRALLERIPVSVTDAS